MFVFILLFMGGFPTLNEIGGIHFSEKTRGDTSEISPLSELPNVLMCLNHVARCIVNANHSIM
jgi:hypothetical protein